MSAFMRVTRSRLPGLLGGLLLLTMAGLAHAGTVTYVYTDPQGTPLAEANASGTITATYDYAPYGNQAMGAAHDGPGYTGHVNDVDTGLVYMQARYYDPSVGRFISTDPLEPGAGNAFNFNRYDYANNNPVINLDPDGRDVAGPGYVVYVNPSSSEAGGEAPRPKPKEGGGHTDQQKTLTNVIYNETSAFSPKSDVKPNTPGSAEDLGNGRVAVGEVVQKDIKDGHSEWIQAKSQLTARESAHLKAGDPSAIAAMAGASAAAKQVLAGSHTVNGATQYRTRFSDNVTTPVGKSGANPGTPVTAHFGPFDSSTGPTGIGVIVVGQ